MKLFKGSKTMLGAYLALAFAQLSAAPEGAAAEAKKVKFCDKEYDLDTGNVEFAFGNGKKLVCESSRIHEATATVRNRSIKSA